MIHLAIVGLGPWGLAALDRIVTAARRRPGLRIHVTAVDPGPPGPGVHAPTESPLVLLNTVAGQVDSFSAAHFGEPALPGALGFLAWARRNGHPGASGDAFLPRAVLGRYLAFVFGVLRDAAPGNLELDVVRDEVIAIEPCPGERARVALRGGGSATVDRVLLCTGHGPARVARPAMPEGSGVIAVPPAPATVPAALRPYPIARLDAAVGRARSVGVAGLGLVAVDVVAALTQGRGGRFERVRTAHERERIPRARESERSARERGDKPLVYRPSGAEPVLFVFSRSGIPFSCRPATTPDLALRYDPIHCTAERVAALAAGRALDLRRDVLAPVVAEMRAAFALRTLALADRAAAADDLRRQLRTAKLADAAAIVDAAVPAAAAFQPEQLLCAEQLVPGGDPAAVRDAFVRRLAFDVAEARRGEDASAFKSGLEILRVVRHALRAGVEHGRLAPDSRLLWNRVVAPRIAQLIVGPPVSRGEEWLALIDAGILRLDFAQAPAIERRWTRSQWRAEVSGAIVTASTHFDQLVQGHLDDGAPAITGDGLWPRLYADGLCSTLRDGDSTQLRLDRDGHLIDATGQVVRAVHVFGAPTEGSTYFNHYLPSPRSRAGAFEKLRDTVDRIFDDAAPARPGELARPARLGI